MCPPTSIKFNLIIQYFAYQSTNFFVHFLLNGPLPSNRGQQLLRNNSFFFVFFVSVAQGNQFNSSNFCLTFTPPSPFSHIPVKSAFLGRLGGRRLLATFLPLGVFSPSPLLWPFFPPPPYFGGRAFYLSNFPPHQTHFCSTPKGIFATLAFCPFSINFPSFLLSSKSQ